MKKLFLSLILMVLPLVVSAYDCQIDGIYYNLDSKIDNISFTSDMRVAEVTYEAPNYRSDYSGAVVIPESITYEGVKYSVAGIGEHAFQNCSSLTSVSIPNSVIWIGIEAFSGCSGLTSVTIPNSVYWILNGAFSGCSGLTSITIGNSVWQIGNYAFSWCSGLISVEIPNSVTSIGEYSFAYCSGLTSVTIPSSVNRIGWGAFSFCDALTSVHITDLSAWCNINFGDNNANPLYNLYSGLYIDNKIITNLIIPDDITTIKNYSFSGCKYIDSITIPNTVTSIGEYAFENCWSLDSLIIPNSITSIGVGAFHGCSHLTSVTIPNSLTRIEKSVFALCLSLTSVTIPNSVTSIGAGAFSQCSGLTSITIPNSVTSIEGNIVFRCNSLFSVKVDNENMHYDSRNDCNAIIETESNRLIAGCMNTIIPNTVTDIGNRAFDGCHSLTSIAIPSSVTTIEERAFNYCTGLASVTIPHSVNKIGKEAFAACYKLEEVYCFADNLPQTDNSIFAESNQQNVTLYVPEASLSDYQNTAPWSEFGSFKSYYDAIPGKYVASITSFFSDFGPWENHEIIVEQDENDDNKVWIYNLDPYFAQYKYFAPQYNYFYGFVNEEKTEILIPCLQEAGYQDVCLYGLTNAKTGFLKTDGYIVMRVADGGNKLILDKAFGLCRSSNLKSGWFNLNIGPTVFTKNSTTGIGAIPDSKREVSKDAPVYNLSGQRLNKVSKGIYIKNGKKVVVK